MQHDFQNIRPSSEASQQYPSGNKVLLFHVPNQLWTKGQTSDAHGESPQGMLAVSSRLMSMFNWSRKPLGSNLFSV